MSTTSIKYEFVFTDDYNLYEKLTLYERWLKANNAETISFEEIPSEKVTKEIHELFDTMIDLHYNVI